LAGHVLIWSVCFALGLAAVYSDILSRSSVPDVPLLTIETEEGLMEFLGLWPLKENAIKVAAASCENSTIGLKKICYGL